MARRGAARRREGRRGSARGGAARGGAARGGAARGGAARGGTAQHGSARGGTGRDGAAQHGAGRHGTWPGVTGSSQSPLALRRVRGACEVRARSAKWPGWAAELTPGLPGGEIAASRLDTTAPGPAGQDRRKWWRTCRCAALTTTTSDHLCAGHRCRRRMRRARRRGCSRWTGAGLNPPEGKPRWCSSWAKAGRAAAPSRQRRSISAAGRAVRQLPGAQLVALSIQLARMGNSISPVSAFCWGGGPYC